MKLFELLFEDTQTTYEPEELLEATKDTFELMVNRTEAFLKLQGNVNKFDPDEVRTFRRTTELLLGSSFKTGLFQLISNNIKTFRDVKNDVEQLEVWSSLNGNLYSISHWAIALLNLANTGRFISRTIAKTFSEQCLELNEQIAAWFQHARIRAINSWEEDEEYSQ